ncbi:unnamed protein product [Protopolystoma xenopodis]|uniref:Uncharacterized protein n=1 Tax=Protopolystoma xenopodis TaxID=117903 RepID=A0A448XDJ2_9PLAT|nr:unnamed protein product [Protopolystoma xenopodis]
MPARSNALDVLNRSEGLAPGRLGYCRASMYTRETLQRAQVGQARHHSLPKMPADHVYGKPYNSETNAVAKCLVWPTHSPSGQSDRRQLPKDFKRVNIESTKAGIHYVPEWIRFAKDKDFRINPTQRALGRLHKSTFPAEMCFGKPTRPSTPMGCLLAHAYKTNWDQWAYRSV